MTTTPNPVTAAARLLAMAQLPTTATAAEVAALAELYHLILQRLHTAGGLRPVKEWSRTTKGTTARTTCLRGHRLIMPNLRPDKLLQGKRECRSCTRARDYARYRPGADLQTVSDSYYRKLMGTGGMFTVCPSAVGTAACPCCSPLRPAVRRSSPHSQRAPQAHCGFTRTAEEVVSPA